MARLTHRPHHLFHHDCWNKVVLDFAHHKHTGQLGLNMPKFIKKKKIPLIIIGVVAILLMRFDLTSMIIIVLILLICAFIDPLTKRLNKIKNTNIQLLLSFGIFFAPMILHGYIELGVEYYLVKHQAPKDKTELCGTLIKNKHYLFPLSPLNPPNFIISTPTGEKGFRTEIFGRAYVNFTNLTLNQPICVEYIGADKGIHITYDYITSVKQSP